MHDPSLPRFEAAQRRDFLKRAAALGAIALVPGLAAACSNDDKATFADASKATTSTAAPSTTTEPSGTTGAETDAGATSTTTGGSTTSGSPLPEGAALDVSFTWGASSSGFGGRNPYIAVWIETAAGELVANISVWYDPPKGYRWVNNLTSWYNAVTTTSSDYLATTTGATRAAGSYAVSWDGTDTSGERAVQGDYVVFIESAQEHAAHSLTSAPITLGVTGAKASLADDGDLSAAAATYTS